MNEESQPWAVRFRPRRISEITGNRRAVNEFLRWLRSWEKGAPKKRAAFLHGPPGTGKTAAVQAMAGELGYDLLEVNASDYRTKNRMEELIGRAALQTVNVFGRRRMILFDEMEGVSGREDRGGISAIAGIIKDTRSPIVLIATTVSEGMEDKFRPLMNLSTFVEFKPVPFSEVLGKLEEIASEVNLRVEEEVLETIAGRAEGDLRSAINDLESVARGKERVTIQDIGWLGERDRREYTPDLLMNMFSARTLMDARKAISQAYINYDDLFDWIYENTPLVLDDPRDLYEGLEALSKADIYQNRAKSSQQYRLLKYMFNDMTGGVALARGRSKGTGLTRQVESAVASLGFPPSAFTTMEGPEGFTVRPNKWLGKERWREVNSAFRAVGGSWAYDENVWKFPYFRAPQLKWRYIRTYHSRRRMQGIADRVAERCHISTGEAVSEVIPLMQVIMKADEGMAEEISGWLGLEEKEVEWLRG